MKQLSAMSLFYTLSVYINYHLIYTYLFGFKIFITLINKKILNENLSHIPLINIMKMIEYNKYFKTIQINSYSKKKDNLIYLTSN